MSALTLPASHSWAPRLTEKLEQTAQTVLEKARHCLDSPITAEVSELDALRAKDPAAITRMVESHAEMLYRSIYRLIRDGDEAENLVQETFYRALKNIHTFRGDSQISTWLYGIGINVARSYLRQAKRTQTLGDADVDHLQPLFTGEGKHTISYEAWHPEKHFERQERIEWVHKAIAQLPESYRTILVLRDLEERSSEEVEEILGLSSVNMRVRLHRARNALRSLLADHL